MVLSIDLRDLLESTFKRPQVGPQWKMTPLNIDPLWEQQNAPTKNSSEQINKRLGGVSNFSLLKIYLIVLWGLSVPAEQDWKIKQLFT